MCHLCLVHSSKLEMDGYQVRVMIVFYAHSYRNMQGSNMGDDAPSQACTNANWIEEGQLESLKLVRDGRQLDGTHSLIVKSNNLMHVMLMLMVDRSSKGLKENKDLRLESSRLLVSEDVEMELKKSRYQEFLKKFEGYAMGVCHQMAKSWEEGRVTVGCFSFVISSIIIFDVFGLVEEGLKITWEKHSQRIDLDFFSSNEKISQDDTFILREGLPYP